MGKGILDASAQNTLHLLAHLVRYIAPEDNTAQRQGQCSASLPLEAKVGNEFEVATFIYETALVDKHSRIGLATLHSSGNLREEHRRAALNLGEEATDKCIGRSVQARHKDMADGRSVALAAYQQGAIATAKCARLITDEYVKQRSAAESALTGTKEGSTTIASLIDPALANEKAVKNAINHMSEGDYVIVDAPEQIEDELCEGED